MLIRRYVFSFTTLIAASAIAMSAKADVAPVASAASVAPVAPAASVVQLAPLSPTSNTSTEAAREFRVMTYNVQNLFDTVDNPNTKDEEFTPNGAQRWSEGVLRDKLANLGEVIESQSPDILGLAEVENQEVLERLVHEGMKKTGAKYQTIIAAETDDGRGVRTALISRFPEIARESHTVGKLGANMKPTRRILDVTLDVGGGQRVSVLVNHWPSRANQPGSRMAVAKEMERITQDIQKKDPNRLVLALGDFNDELGDPSLTRGLDMVERSEDLGAKLASYFAADTDLASLPDAERGTYYYHPAHQWNALDHILVSEGPDLARGTSPGFHYRAKSIEVVHSRFSTRDGAPTGCELVRGRDLNSVRADGGCSTGASDHRALAATFERR